MASKKVSKPDTIEGGPIIVEFKEPPKPQVKKNNVPPKEIPKKKKKDDNILSAKDFVEKYRKEVVTASWDPKVLRKCGKGAKEILSTLGVHIPKENVPFKVQQRRRKARMEKEEQEMPKK